jgi:hypothetical protein
VNLIGGCRLFCRLPRLMAEQLVVRQWRGMQADIGEGTVVSVLLVFRLKKSTQNVKFACQNVEPLGPHFINNILLKMKDGRRKVESGKMRLERF